MFSFSIYSLSNENLVCAVIKSFKWRIIPVLSDFLQLLWSNSSSECNSFHFMPVVKWQIATMSRSSISIKIK